MPIPYLVLTLLASLCAPSPVLGSVPIEGQTPDGAVLAGPSNQADVEFEKRKTEAGDDVRKLWSVYEWCVQTKREREGKTILKRIVKLEPNHKEANLALGHVEVDGQWFPNQKKADEYKKQKELEERRAQGLVEWKGQWVPAADVPYLERGLVRDENGAWITQADAKKIAEGWTRQDLDWVSPDEKANLEKHLWKCGSEWLAIAEADKYHAELGQWWRIAGDRFHMYTTCERDLAVQRIKRELDDGYDDLTRIYGTHPAAPIVVIVLRDSSQYGSYAAGDEFAQRENTDALGLSSVHYAYFADLSVEADTGARLDAGAGYWDASSEEKSKWGVHSVRHALGLSFGEALDGSPKTIERNVKTRMSPQQFWDSFYAEKRFPRWFRYGAATYVERYYHDDTVGGGGKPYWTREWSVDNIRAKGGLRQLKQVLEFDLSTDSGPDGAKLINESGLVISWILDGGKDTAKAKLKAVQDALAAIRAPDAKPAGEKEREKAFAAAIKALEEEVLASSDAIKAYAGL